MYKRSIESYNKETLTAFFIFLIFWLGMALYSKYLPSNFHIQEDHEIIDQINNIQSVGYWNALSNEIKNDLDARFRPLYIAYRYTCSYFFGLNLLYWHILLFIVQLAVMLLCFRICQLLAFSFGISILVPFILVTGSVTESIVRLGTSELFGAFFFAIAIYLVLKFPSPKKLTLRTNLCVHLCVLLACLTKESFITLIPIVIAVKLFTAQIHQKTTTTKTIHTNLIFILFQLLILVFCFSVIKFHISKQNESLYGGFDSNILNTVSLLLKTLSFGLSTKTIINGNGIYLLFMFVGYITVYFMWSRFDFQQKKTILFYSFVALFICTVQFIIHAKIVLEGHYLLPFMFAPALIIGILSNLILKFSEIKRKSVIYIALWALVILKANQSYAQLITYTSEGAANIEMLKLIDQSANKKTTILIVGDELIHMEHFTALPKYIYYTYPNITQVRLILFPTNIERFMQISGTNDLSIVPEIQKIIVLHFQDVLYEKQSPYQDFDAIIILSDVEKTFLDTYKRPINFSDYTKKIVGKSWYQYTLYQKRI